MTPAGDDAPVSPDQGLMDREIHFEFPCLAKDNRGRWRAGKVERGVSNPPAPREYVVSFGDGSTIQRPAKQLRRVPPEIATNQPPPPPTMTTAPDPITAGLAVTIRLTRRGKHLTAATIKTVGRKWVTLATGGLEYRFARPTTPYPAVIALDGNGYPSPGDVVLDAAKLESDRARGAAWRELLEALKAHPFVPDSVSLEAITAARKALGL